MLNKAIIGKKVGMTQIFNADGKVIPCTVIEAGPCVVTQLKTEEKDGYNAVQFGFEDVKEARLNKPQKGHLKKAALRSSSAMLLRLTCSLPAIMLTLPALPRARATLA